MQSTLSFVLCLLVGSAVCAQDPWTTYRGNSQRTGNTDNKPGPAAKPKVLWALKSRDQFLSSPVPVGKRLFVSGLGALNTAYFACLDTDPKATKRVLWQPELTQPTVSSPGIFNDKIVFGDGMHQNNGANLHCFNLVTGKRVWQLPVPGNLVHIEGSPVVVGNKVFVGGGAAGVLCVDAARLKIDGKEMASATIKKILDEKWADLQAKYKKEKEADDKLPPGKRNPFLREPSLDMLPMVQPTLLWQAGHQGKGKDKMHVDSPLAVVGDKVLIGSAYLDVEKEGDRALICLDAESGKQKWRSPVKLNPWGGPTVAGKVVIVTGSDINYDVKLIGPKNKGMLTAFDLDTGAELWNKSIDKAAVVSCAAVAGNVAVISATDGKIRAFDIANNGARQWNQPYDAKAPLFAPVAIVNNVVYAGDLKGVVHAVDLKTGAGLWTLDVGKEVGAPGMIFAGPVVQDGRVYVVTNNMEGPNVNQDGAVVCLGEK